MLVYIILQIVVGISYMHIHEIRFIFMRFNLGPPVNCTPDTPLDLIYNMQYYDIPNH